jgi:hypothetical protein
VSKSRSGATSEGRRESRKKCASHLREGGHNRPRNWPDELSGSNKVSKLRVTPFCVQDAPDPRCAVGL